MHARSHAEHAVHEAVGVAHDGHGRVGDRLEGRELGRHGCAVEADERAPVAHLVTVVGRAEHCDAVAAVLHLVPRLLHLHLGLE